MLKTTIIFDYTEFDTNRFFFKKLGYVSYFIIYFECRILISSFDTDSSSEIGISATYSC